MTWGPDCSSERHARPRGIDPLCFAGDMALPVHQIEDEACEKVYIMCCGPDQMSKLVSLVLNYCPYETVDMDMSWSPSIHIDLMQWTDSQSDHLRRIYARRRPIVLASFAHASDALVQKVSINADCGSCYWPGAHAGARHVVREQLPHKHPRLRCLPCINTPSFCASTCSRFTTLG